MKKIITLGTLSIAFIMQTASAHLGNVGVFTGETPRYPDSRAEFYPDRFDDIYSARAFADSNEWDNDTQPEQAWDSEKDVNNQWVSRKSSPVRAYLNARRLRERRFKGANSTDLVSRRNAIDDAQFNAGRFNATNQWTPGTQSSSDDFVSRRNAIDDAQFNAGRFNATNQWTPGTQSSSDDFVSRQNAIDDTQFKAGRFNATNQWTPGTQSSSDDFVSRRNAIDDTQFNAGHFNNFANNWQTGRRNNAQDLNTIAEEEMN